MAKNRKLALSLADASFGEIIRQQTYKSAATGGMVVKVGRFFASSKSCSHCRYVNGSLTLSERTWRCEGCGIIHDRDWNASKNIEQEAFRLALDEPNAGSGYVGVSAWTECKTSLEAGLVEARTDSYI